jgi:hypothetical protein
MSHHQLDGADLHVYYWAREIHIIKTDQHISLFEEAHIAFDLCDTLRPKGACPVSVQGIGGNGNGIISTTNDYDPDVASISPFFM